MDNEFQGLISVSPILISAFPGTGKTYFRDQYPATTLDSDSSQFSWDKDGNRNPDFPQNYIQHIKEKLQKGVGLIIFVSSHKVVRDALLENNIHFLLIFPERELKEEYLKRFRDRGSDNAFVDLLKKNWDVWMDDMESQIGCEVVRLKSGEFLGELILNIERIDEAIAVLHSGEEE